VTATTLSAQAACRQILIARGGAIGDFVLTLPVLSALRRHDPAARIQVLGHPPIAQLAVAGGVADGFRDLESREMATAFAPNASLVPEVVRYLAGFDLILSYLHDPDQIFEANLQQVSAARFLAGPHRPGPEGGQHATEALLAPLASLGALPADPVPRLRLQAAAPRACDGPAGWLAADRCDAPCLAAHPGSGSERKNWPEPRWAELLSRLAAETPWRLLLVGGEAEGDRLDRLARCWPADRLECARSLPLVELALRLAACRFFLGHDSGIMHLAAALGIPGLVLWGESPFRVWRPLQTGMECLVAGSRLPQLEAAEVWDVLSTRLPAFHPGTADLRSAAVLAPCPACTSRPTAAR